MHKEKRVIDLNRVIAKPVYLVFFLAFVSSVLPAQVMLQPAADAAFTNIIVGSGVAPDGTKSHTTDVYLVKADGSLIRNLTTLDQTNGAPGATAVAISPDGTRAAYLAALTAGGNEEVHAIDLGSGADRLISMNTQACSQAPCLSALSFSQDGTRLVWQFENGTTSQIMVGNSDGSGVATVNQGGVLSGSQNVTTADGRLIFANYGCGLFCEQIATVKLDGTGLTSLWNSPNTIDLTFGDPVISADGSEYAYLCQGYSPSHQTPTANVVVSPAVCGGSSTLVPALSSLTISHNGAQVAWLSHGQIELYAGNYPAFAEVSGFDVLLSGDASRLLYSVGSPGGQREAVWISDVTGANAHPVFAPRYITSGGIVGLGSVAGNSLPLSPGSYFTIYGANLENADALVTAAALPFPNTLANVSAVTVNGTPVPIQAVTPWQINAILPQNFGAGPATVTVSFADVASVTQMATVAQTAAAVSTYLMNPASGMLGAAAFHAGTKILADANNPAHAGEILETYGFGLGATTPAVAAGIPAPLSPLANPSPPAVSIGPVFAGVTFAGLVPGVWAFTR